MCMWTEYQSYMGERGRVSSLDSRNQWLVYVLERKNKNLNKPTTRLSAICGAMDDLVPKTEISASSCDGDDAVGTG